MWFLPLLGLANATALESMATTTNGPLRAGMSSEVELVLLEDGEVYGGLIEKAETTGGQLLDLQRVEGEPWRAHVRAEPGSENVALRLVAEDGRALDLDFPVLQQPLTALVLPERLDARAGQDAFVSFDLVAGEPLEATQVALWASEGEWGPSESTEDGLRLSWRPSDARQAHMALLGFQDLRQAESLPQ